MNVVLKLIYFGFKEITVTELIVTYFISPPPGASTCTIYNLQCNIITE